MGFAAAAVTPSARQIARRGPHPSLIPFWAMTYLCRALVILLDLLLVIIAVVMIGIGITGGGRLHLYGWTVRMTSVGNPTIVALVLLLFRYFAISLSPRFLGFDSLSLHRIEFRIVDRVQAFRHWIDTSRANRLIVLVIAFSVGLRLLNVVLHPGFTTGDDVEVQEIALSRVLGEHWSIWNVRSPLYPMVFIYPAQKLLAELGVSGTGFFVAAGRLVVLAIATASLYLVYRISRDLTDSPLVGVLALGLFASSRLHVWYGSSELPRPVATVFILLAFYFLLRRSAWRAAGAGVLLAIGGCLRFGELVFLAPAGLQLFAERRWREALVVALTATTAALLLLGGSDWLYWGEPFFSWRNAFEYTIIEGRSSRGFQPPLYYLATADAWANYFVLALSGYSFRLEDKRPAFWCWLPIAILSMLPHKEPRYLIAVSPFIYISAAMAGTHLFRRAASHPRRVKWAAAIAVLMMAAWVRELGDWQFRRTDSAVRFAAWLESRNPDSVAAQQLWRLGGRIYFSTIPVVRELPDDTDDAIRALAQSDFEWVLLRHELASLRHVAWLQKTMEIVAARDLEYVVFQRRLRAPRGGVPSAVTGLPN